MTAIGIYGSEGRMGRVIATIAEDEGARIAGGVDAGGDPVPLAHAADVLVDFSTPAALESHLAAAVAARTPMVIGTTGLLPTHHAMIDRAAQEIASEGVASAEGSRWLGRSSASPRSCRGSTHSTSAATGRVRPMNNAPTSRLKLR